MGVFKMGSKSTKKVPSEVRRVSPAQRERWREEMDRGAPATAIADREGYNKRTVRFHVAKARRAGVASSARAELLRDALRGHQEDLIAIAKSLVEHFRRGVPPGPVKSPDGLPGSALADHLGRRPSGRTLRRWLSLADEYPSLRTGLGQRTELDSMVVALVAKGVSDSSLPQQVLRLAEGGSLESLPKVASGGPEADELNAERDVILGAVQRWDEFIDAKNCCDEARVLAHQLVDRLDELRLRRYLTGSCRYCPDAEGD
jgi:hypothetical protein